MDSETIQKSLGRLARVARDRKGLTQLEVAELLGISSNLYGSIERGMMMPALMTLRRLAVALDLSADQLLGLSPQEELSPELRQLVDRLREQPGSKVRLLLRLLECVEQEAAAQQYEHPSTQVR
jgi:transcriptional regulator with XRE-family HTH domain